MISRLIFISSRYDCPSDFHSKMRGTILQIPHWQCFFAMWLYATGCHNKNPFIGSVLPSVFNRNCQSALRVFCLFFNKHYMNFLATSVWFFLFSHVILCMFLCASKKKVISRRIHSSYNLMMCTIRIRQKWAYVRLCVCFFHKKIQFQIRRLELLKLHK